MNDFSAGSVLRRGMEVFFKNFSSFVFLSLLVYSPLIVYGLIVIGDMSTQSLDSLRAVMLVGGLVLPLVATAAMMHGTLQQLRGRPLHLGESAAFGLQRPFLVLGVGFLSALAVAGGFFLLVIPGLVAFCMLWVAVPVAVVEECGMMKSLRRSTELTKGNRLQIFGILLVLGLGNFLVSKVLEASLIGPEMTEGAVKAYILLSIIFSAVSGALAAVVNAVGYHDLRLSRNGDSPIELASVFRS